MTDARSAEGHVSGRQSGHPEVMAAMFPQDYRSGDRAGHRCMVGVCGHLVSEHLDAPAGRLPCLVPGCSCDHLQEDPT